MTKSEIAVATRRLAEEVMEWHLVDLYPPASPQWVDKDGNHQRYDADGDWSPFTSIADAVEVAMQFVKDGSYFDIQLRDGFCNLSLLPQGMSVTQYSECDSDKLAASICKLIAKALDARKGQ